MLYIFQVDVGQMMTFDINFSLESVATLKNEIFLKYNIPIDKQVLLISGGENLEDNYSVVNYNGVGVDTNPIFLFNKLTILQLDHLSLSQFNNQDENYTELNLIQIENQINETLKMKPSYDIVVARTDIAKKINQLTVEINYNCETLIRDQHLQYQGWSAVIANLEDVTIVFKENVKMFVETYKVFLTNRYFYFKRLESFEQYLQKLSSIIILPSLLSDKKQESTTLLQWISQKDDEESLKKIKNYCITALQQFNDETFNNIKHEINETIKIIENKNNKKIKKIEQRLYNLDMMLTNFKKMILDQNLLTNGFIQNQNSANQCRDSSIFPDLCNLHKKQLKLMLDNYKKSIKIYKKFLNSKKELTYSLLTRLQRIMVSETNLNSLKLKILIYSKNLCKLKRNLDIIEQINLTPEIYYQAINEMIRRKNFNEIFHKWTSNIVKISIKSQSEENTKREEFQNIISNHFLKALFPGYEDRVPDFATNEPSEFDLTFPKFDINEFENLSRNNDFYNNFNIINEIKINCDCNRNSFNELNKPLKLNDSLHNSLEKRNKSAFKENFDNNKKLNSRLTKSISLLNFMDIDKRCETELFEPNVLINKQTNQNLNFKNNINKKNLETLIESVKKYHQKEMDKEIKKIKLLYQEKLKFDLSFRNSKLIRH